MEIRFLPAAPADVAALLVLMREFYAHDQHTFEEEKARRAVEDCIADGRLGRLWLVQAGDGEIAGYIALTFGYCLEYGGRDAFIDELYLREAYRGQGIGRQVIDFLCDFCRGEGIRALELEVMSHNEQARAFYRRAGFEERDSLLMSQHIR